MQTLQETGKKEEADNLEYDFPKFLISSKFSSLKRQSFLSLRSVRIFYISIETHLRVIYTFIKIFIYIYATKL